MDDWMRMPLDRLKPLTRRPYYAGTVELILSLTAGAGFKERFAEWRRAHGTWPEGCARRWPAYRPAKRVRSAPGAAATMAV